MVVAAAQPAVLTTTDGSSKAVGLATLIIGVVGNVQCLADERALQGHVLGIARREAFVNGP